MLQFVTVLVYTAVSFATLPADMEQRVRNCYMFQTFEMATLLCFFMDFFIRKYRTRKSRKSSVDKIVPESVEEQESLSSASSTEPIDST